MFANNYLGLLTAASLLSLTSLAIASPAVSLAVGDCPVWPPTCTPGPGGPPHKVIGQPVSFWVFALDSTNFRATNYSGTVTFTSSDPSATLPSPHIFTASDNSTYQFSVTANSLPVGASSPASVTITASDAAGLTGSGQFLFYLAPSLKTEAAPSLSFGAECLLGVLLCILATLRQRPLTIRSTRP